MSKLVLIDGHAILHRAYHALPPLTSRVGQINAVYGFVSMLLKVIVDLKPTHIAVCFDRDEKTFRQEMFKAYQTQRPEMDKELFGQVEKTERVVEAFRIPIFSMAGYEADDLLGSIAEQAHSAKGKAHGGEIDEAIIVTGDRDILQLVDDRQNIKLYMPIKGLSEAKIFTEKETVERMGVPAKQIVDYKALVGDPSDNYPGVRGIGPKTAEKLLNEFGSFKNIYKNLNKIPEKTRQILIQGREGGEISYKLAQIKNDVPIKIDFKKMSNWKVDSNRVLSLFAEFGFKALTKRVEEVGRRINSEKQLTLM